MKEPAFEATAVIAEKNAKTLAVEILAISEDEFRVAFRGSAMSRAKNRGLKGNSAVWPGANASDKHMTTLAAPVGDPRLLVRVPVARPLGPHDWRG